MFQTINYNGNILNSSELKLNRGFLFGDGFFETMRFDQSHCLLAKYHENRILQGAKIHNLELQQADSEYLMQEVAKYVKHINLPHARIKLIIYRAGGGAYIPNENNYEYLILGYSLVNNSLFGELQHVDLMEIKRVTSPFNAVKPLSAQWHVMAGRSCKEAKREEGVFVNNDGNLCEGLYSNIFWIKDEEIFTPSLASGCVHGTMRAFIIDALNNSGKRVHEVLYKDDALENCEELFFTNAIKGIQTVNKYNGRWLNNKQTRFLYHQLFEG